MHKQCCKLTFSIGQGALGRWKLHWCKEKKQIPVKPETERVEVKGTGQDGGESEGSGEEVLLMNTSKVGVQHE